MARIAEQQGKPKPTDLMSRNGEDAIRRAKLFETDLVNHVILPLEKNYRAISNRDGRAIGGFSGGCGQTLRSAFGTMDKFCWICCYNAYLSTPEMESNFKQIGNPEKTKCSKSFNRSTGCRKKRRNSRS
jgi:enterochelin esterase-like enzyme